MINLAYILAASHSGSTLLSMLLGSHPQIATIGEMKLSRKAIGDLDCYRCSCREFIQNCKFWKKVRNEMAKRGLEFDLACAGTNYSAIESRYAQHFLSPLYRGKFFESFRDIALNFSPTWQKQLPKIHKQNAALASVILEITNAKVIVDSSKIALRLKYLLRNPDLDIKVIHLIRDGQAVALTYMDPAEFADAQNPSMREGGMGGDRENERLSMAQAAYKWRRCNEEAENILSQLDPSRYIEVRYEQLCTDPDATLKRIFSFLDVNPSMAVKDFRSIEQHIVGNGMRLDTSSEVRLDERWRETLTGQDLLVFDTVAGKMNRRYGYI